MEEKKKNQKKNPEFLNTHDSFEEKVGFDLIPPISSLSAPSS